MFDVFVVVVVVVVFFFFSFFFFFFFFFFFLNIISVRSRIVVTSSCQTIKCRIR
jgi:hypothetical protein